MNQHECTHPQPVVVTTLSTRDKNETVTAQDHVLCRDCRLSVPLGEPWMYVYAQYAECLKWDEGWYCTRPKGHPGRHIATGSRSDYCHDWEETE